MTKNLIADETDGRERLAVNGPLRISLNGAIETIAAQASAQPNAAAVCGLVETITFRQLEERSNRLARHLRARGIGCETPVGLYTERSPQFVIGALAILKAGGAYVPLDPTGPPQRIATILRDCGAPVLLSHKWKAAGLPSGPWATVDMDVDQPAIDACPASPLAAAHAANSLAYIIYTSGSTGAPKGVEVTHANLAHLMDWHQREYQVASHSRASQLAGLGFDAAVWEIWCHLGAGASLHMIDEASRLSAGPLRDWLVQQKITIAFVPTLMAEHLLALDWPASTALRTLLTGADTLRRYPRNGLPFDVVNHYGPTECTVLVTSGVVPVVDPHAEQRAQLPTIGRVINGMHIRIVDADLQPVATGETGELCVAGPQVARGYRGMVQATAEKFVPMSGAPCGRLYRTGDRARFLPNGELAFLGRLDRQIKIRGYRVEPDEIAAQLNRHPEVRQSTVIARADQAGEPMLTAYLALDQDSQLTAEALRSFLAPNLAGYMIPGSFVRMEALPINANGKCDHEALPAPAPENMLPEDDSFPSGADLGLGATRTRLTSLVSGLTGLAEVGLDDNFFMIGGHSMLAAQLVAKVQDQFGVNLSLRQLFESPTVELLAAAIDHAPVGAQR